MMNRQRRRKLESVMLDDIKYFDQLWQATDNAIRKALSAIGVTLADIKQSPNRFQHIIFPDGRQEWRWDGIRLARWEPLGPPQIGVKVIWFTRPEHQ